MPQVFVYGTLKRGQRNAHYLQQAQYLGEFVTDAAYRMFLFDDYPAVCLQGSHAIRGEVYRVTETEFNALDELEGYPDFYQRIEIDTSFGQSWVYIVTADLCHERQELAGLWPAPSGG